jgi:heat shock protein HtpX
VFARGLLGRSAVGATSCDVPFNARRTARKLHNLLHSACLMLAMAVIVALCGLAVGGPEFAVATLVMAALAAVTSPTMAPSILLRVHGARPLRPYEAPALHEAMRTLSRRAGLSHVPCLCYAPGAHLNAYSIGTRKRAAVVLTAGLLRCLSPRELTGVLAHEVSHIANNDVRLMNVADVMNRTASLLSYFGMALLLLNLPSLVAEQATAPWLLVGTLSVAPLVLAILQLALSRSREFDADLDAVALTRDPDGLISALAKLERLQGGNWERLGLPGRGASLLRTHPRTEERIRRLRELRGPASDADMPSYVIVTPLGLRLIRAT